MPLVKRGRIVADTYVRVTDDAPVADGVAVIVPAARFLADTGRFARRTAATGVLWPNDRRIAELAPWLDRLALVALAFPSFRDGRAYSQARLLRERCGFRGELRATGGVLQDQASFMLRCGFDSFESDQKGFGEALAKARTLFSVVYQPTEDGRATASLLRLGRRKAVVS